MNGSGLLETAWQDARHCWRTMRRAPGFTATAVVTLALAIGGNTAMFTIIRAVLLNPLPYRDSDQLVQMGNATPSRFLEMRASAQSFSDLGAYTRQEAVTLATGTEPEVLKGIRVSESFLRILKVDPLLGRGFRREEDAAGGAPVALISSELWQRRFGGDPQIVGKTVTLSATPCVIAGVLPPRFQFPTPGLDVWMTAPTEWPLMPLKSRTLSPFLTIFGRMKPGVSLNGANEELKGLRHQYAMAHPTMLDARSRSPRELTPIKDELVGSVRTMLWMLFGAVGFVLLIACANVASLLLARSTTRAREFAVRAALGAARLRLMGQLLVESVLLSFLGGVLGLGLAVALLRVIPAMTSFELPRTGEIRIDWIVLVFAGGLSVLTGILFGLAPSVGASRPDLIHVLRASGPIGQTGHGRSWFGLNLRGLLPVGQVALSVVLLIGAALLMESVMNLRGVNVGFNASNLLTMRVSLPTSRYDTGLKQSQFFQELITQVGSLPGVRGVTAGMSIPMSAFAGSPVQDASKPVLKLNERPVAKLMPVTPGYFQTFEIPLLRGRAFTERDTEEAQRVTVIDESMARRFWPGYPARQDPIGQRLLIGGVNPKPAEVIGIVANVHQSLENDMWPETMYVAFAQNAQPFAMVAVRTAGDPLSFANAVRSRVRAVDRDQPVAEVRSMDDLVEEEVGQRRLLVLLLGAFAVVALLLAVIGIYGVVAYSAAQRTQEVGIRRALGAQQADILRLVVGHGFALAVAGIGLGLAGAYGLTRVMKTVLFGVSPTDPLTFGGIAVLFLVVALGASYVPARRAARVDPMTALRV